MPKRIKLKRNNLDVFIDTIYPVGSIYMSVNPTDPQVLFGGTWEQITDRFLYCTDNSMNTGGNSTIDLSHYHSLSNNGYAKITMHDDHGICYEELQAPTWTPNYRIAGSSATNQPGHNDYWGAGLGGRTEYSGSSTTNIMPPYFTVYCWRRTS